VTAEGIEGAIQERGRRLLQDIQPTRLLSFSPDWWQERMLAWANSDPDFRVKLLQFVDVLPTLRTSAAVADHVRQYFRDGGPGIASVGSDLASRRAFRPVLSRVVRHGVEKMADRFIAGATPQESLRHLEALAHAGVAHTVDLLGEATLSDDEADAYLARYLELIRLLTAAAQSWDVDPPIRQPNISIKLSALVAHLEPAGPDATLAALRPRIEQVFRTAREHGAFVYIDMEQYRYRDLIHHVADRVLGEGTCADWPDAGMVVQAYLRDAEGDIERLEALAKRRATPITVRLVKGAYWDEETIVARTEGHPVPVFEDKADTDTNFERCTGRLVQAYPHLRPAFASHHPRSVAQAMVWSETAGIPREDVEFQVLYGMAEGLRDAVVRMGYRTRVYVPSGEIIPGMAYLVRRLLENTSNESWLLHRHEQADERVLERPVRARDEVREPERPFRNHSHAEFHLARDRDAMHEALATAKEPFGGEWPAIIDGTAVDAGEWDQVYAPAHPDMGLGRVARGTVEMAESAVAAAAEAFPTWRNTPPRTRADLLRRVADLLAERRFELAATMVYESAKPWREADGDVAEAIDFLRYYSLQADELHDGEDLSIVPAERNHMVYEGRGVAAIIAPWNFPLAILTGMTAGALAAGCTAVLKPAEQSPVVAAKLVETIHEAGVPPGVVHYLPGPGEVVGQALVHDPRVAMIAFTGSREVGLAIVDAASQILPGQAQIKRIIAELGGKNAIIVDDDADLDEAVGGVIMSAFSFAGQKCSACSRVIVLNTAYEEFRERLAAAVQSLTVGPPEDPYTFVPPVISAEARDRICQYIAIGEQEGRLVARGSSHDEGFYVAPHVFEDVSLDSPLSREEVFGPVLALYRAATFKEALHLAIDSEYALTGGVYSRNPRHIREASAHFRVGNLYINRPITGSMVGRQPFAGFRMSGTGEKAGGPGYVRQFTIPRVVTENTMRRGFAPHPSAMSPGDHA
jgi:RHH-type transcriptional regulator, proline utilization regulon repressor / proline dehydrogenase / delta 1-pyrroline-5-carboxylate dehydrogenase